MVYFLKYKSIINLNLNIEIEIIKDMEIFRAFNLEMIIKTSVADAVEVLQETLYFLGKKFHTPKNTPKMYG